MLSGIADRGAGMGEVLYAIDRRKVQPWVALCAQSNHAEAAWSRQTLCAS